MSGKQIGETWAEEDKRQAADAILKALRRTGVNPQTETELAGNTGGDPALLRKAVALLGRNVKRYEVNGVAYYLETGLPRLEPDV